MNKGASAPVLLSMYGKTQQEIDEISKRFDEAFDEDLEEFAAYEREVMTPARLEYRKHRRRKLLRKNCLLDCIGFIGMVMILKAFWSVAVVVLAFMLSWQFLAVAMVIFITAYFVHALCSI